MSKAQELADKLDKFLNQEARDAAAELRRLSRIEEAANRLVLHADFQLGGCLSVDSKAKDIPSTAVSRVKARHLASLRAALSSTGGNES